MGEEGKGRSALFVGRTRNLPKPLPQCLEDGYEHFRPKLLNHRMRSDKLKKIHVFSMSLFVIITMYGNSYGTKTYFIKMDYYHSMVIVITMHSKNMKNFSITIPKK